MGLVSSCKEKNASPPPRRHPGESRGPLGPRYRLLPRLRGEWIPAFAGMTECGWPNQPPYILIRIPRRLTPGTRHSAPHRHSREGGNPFACALGERTAIPAPMDPRLRGDDGGFWWLAAVRFCEAKRVSRVPADKLVNLAQALWKRLCLSPSGVIYKTKSGQPESTNLVPLLFVGLLGHLERTSHRVKCAATFRALASSLVRQLPRLTADEAGMRPKAEWSPMVGDRRRHGQRSVTRRATKFHSL